MSGGAPKGNQNAKRGREWREAVRKAAMRPEGDKKKLELIAEKTVECALLGEPWAVKEIGDRLDGKAPQETSIELNDQTERTGSELDVVNRLAFLLRRGVEARDNADSNGDDSDMGSTTGTAGDGLLH